MKLKEGSFASQVVTMDQKAAHEAVPQPGKTSGRRIPMGIIVGLGMIALLLSSCAASEPEPTATSAPTLTPTPADTAAPTDTPTPVNTPTITPIPDEITDDAGHLMRIVPAGEFTMGDDPEQMVEICNSTSDNQAVCRPFVFEVFSPQVFYLDAFFMDVFEVTNEQYVRFLNDEGNQNEGGVTWLDSESSYGGHILEMDGEFTVEEGFEDHPAVYVSWYGAQAYCQWRDASLPTGAQWEKAARGTDERVYPWGGDMDGTLANTCDKNTACTSTFLSTQHADDGYLETAPVGSYPQGASPYGLQDMAGNVMEWVADFLTSDPYAAWTYENPTGGEPRTDYVANIIRGGSYYRDLFNAYSAYASYSPPETRSYDLGFRCVSPLTQP